jgi:hypothetical protein
MLYKANPNKTCYNENDLFAIIISWDIVTNTIPNGLNVVDMNWSISRIKASQMEAVLMCAPTSIVSEDIGIIIGCYCNRSRDCIPIVSCFRDYSILTVNDLLYSPIDRKWIKSDNSRPSSWGSRDHRGESTQEGTWMAGGILSETGARSFAEDFSSWGINATSRCRRIVTLAKKLTVSLSQPTKSSATLEMLSSESKRSLC